LKAVRVWLIFVVSLKPSVMIIQCDLNAGMERLFRISSASEYDLSSNSAYSVYLNVQPGTPETRTLRIMNTSTGLQMLAIDLNDSTAKPVNNVTSAYSPAERPNLVYGYEVDTDQYRIFYAEENLSATAGVELFLRIETENDPMVGDIRRYLELSATVGGRVLQADIELNADGGKKPLGGSAGALRVKDLHAGDAVSQ
jgi:hypothetical protein